MSNPKPDPIAAGLARGWNVYGRPHATTPARLHCDVAIVGSGADAGIVADIAADIAAEILTAAGLDVVVVRSMAPWFEQVEQRLSIAPWLVPPNADNERLRRGAAGLGITVAQTRRNVEACRNLGCCGMGCPVNPKQSMLVTEVPPLHPVPASTTMPGFGARHTETLKAFAHTQALLALLRDSFHEQSPGGRVRRRDDGSPVLEYPLTDPVFAGARRALLSMAEIQFAVGARTVTPGHEHAAPYRNWGQARAAIQAPSMKPYLTRIVCAQVMSRCGITGHPELRVGRPDRRHWQLGNLSVHDGSLLPTSIGANPQLSVYGLANKRATQLAKSLSGRDVRLA